MNLTKMIYGLYRTCNDSRFISSFTFLAYHLIATIKYPEYRACNPCNSQKHIPRQPLKPKKIKDIKIAIICDEMTYQSFQEECQLYFITPHNWQTVLEKEQPDFFFCESAWSGIDTYSDCWRGRIYRNEKLFFENRKVLFQIIDYCKSNNIKTVFWNKEDPTYFNQPKYNFSDTATKFDYVLTTASECVSRYHEIGCKNVSTLMFGFSPKLYHPLDSIEKENTAVFAGSWYSEQPERCKDMEQIFDMVIENGIQLKIYDRNYGLDRYKKTYPKKYQQYVLPSVSYTELCDIYRKSRYGININTVKDSRTMFARRVFEMIACNTIVISNESIGLRELFGDSIWFINEKENRADREKMCQDNLKKVLDEHTNTNRLMQILDFIEIPYIPPVKKKSE